MKDPLYQVVNRDGHSPLSTGLYDALRRVYGKVKLANEGEPFRGNLILDSTTGRHDLMVRQAGEYYRVNCPYCQDTGYRLWVNHMFGQPGYNGRPLKHLALCYNESCLQDSVRRDAFYEMLLGFRNARGRQALPPVEQVLAEDPVLSAAEPPGPQIFPVSKLPPAHKAYQYMVGDRRFTHQELDTYNVGYVSMASPKYREAYDRIYFPIHMYGQLVGWQCRYIGDRDWSACGIPKYYSMPGLKRRMLLYNYDNAIRWPFVIVTEGPTSAQAVGGPAVATLGKTVTPRQRELLLTGWVDKPIYFLFDPDALEDMRAIVAELTENRRAPVVALPLPVEGGDPADYNRTALWTLLRVLATRAGVPFPGI